MFDSHAHVISSDTQRYPPDPLSGSLGPSDLDAPVHAERLLGFMDEQAIEQAVLVQRAYVYGFNNDYILDSAQAHPDRLRAVCMVDAVDARTPALIRHLVRDRNAIGIRLTEPFKGADASWFASRQALPSWRTVAELGASMRLHLFRWNRSACLPEIAPLLQQFRETIVVIDHLSNLAAEEGPPDYGLDAALRTLVEHENLYLMFSTINLGKLAAQGISAAPVISHLARAFGPGRIMWGSNIGQSKQSYAEMTALAQAATAELSQNDREQVLSRTAQRVYAGARQPS